MSREGPPGRRPTVSDEEILAAFEASADPVLTTAEVAAQLSIGKRATLERLKKLHEAGAVERKTVGPRGQVWWLADAGAEDSAARASFADDPFLSAPTYASGKGDVSEAIDETLADALDDDAGTEE